MGFVIDCGLLICVATCWLTLLAVIVRVGERFDHLVDDWTNLDIQIHEIERRVGNLEARRWMARSLDG